MPIRHDFCHLLQIPDDAQNIQETTETHLAAMSPETRAQSTRRSFCYDTHVGLCLFESENNGYHDSDFYMHYWDESEQRPKSIQFASTRGYCGAAMGSSVDATPEVMAKYNAWEKEQTRLKWERYETEKREREAKDPTFGKPIRVIRGRKVAIGTTGEVFWRGESQYGERVGIRLADGSKVFTAITNVEVIQK